MLDAVRERGFSPETVAMDKGYDSRAMHNECEARGCRPIIAQIRARNAATPNDVPTCEHGRWTFAGADFGRKTTKWRVRGLERVALHIDLTMLARLSQALARARAVPLAA